MIRWDTYLLDGRRQDFSKAKERKEQLRAAGWRVRIRKAVDGTFEIWKKHRDYIDQRNNDSRFGNRKDKYEAPWKLIRRCME